MKAAESEKGKKMNYVYKFMKSPVGKLKLIAGPKGLAAILWEGDRIDRVRVKAENEDLDHPALLAAESQLKEYFSGQRKSFSIKLDLQGTDFQKQVWNELLEIPFGKTSSYGELAKKIKKPKACRAVGAANGRNPVSIIVPCHRVIGSTGKLTGFAGGVDIKLQLLKLESEGN